ncbi:MAG: hypothetical protein ACJ8R9_02805 [Steroidobacteraceae bacterium]
MGVLGKNWSTGNVLTLIGVITGILVIPAVAFLVPGEFPTTNHEFSRAAAEDLDPRESTCLDDSTQVVPAGLAVCATLHGSWRGGIGPQGLDKHEAMTIWTRQAHPPFLVLTSPRPYQHSERLQESIDFVVCVQPPRGAERQQNAAARMSIDVVLDSAVNCPN